MWILWTVLSLILIKVFNKFRAGRCHLDKVMSGEVVIVTDGASGIGYETALDLARRGAKVILTCRDETIGKAVVERIGEYTRNKSVRHEILDLASLVSIRKFVEKFKGSEAKLDVLINNANAICTSPGDTKDDRYDRVDSFGPFVLTLLLMPWLKKSAPSRVVFVSSVFRITEKIKNHYYGTLKRNDNSKLYNILFSNELARRLEGTGVVVNIVDPGIVFTSIPNTVREIGSYFLLPFLKDSREAAQPVICLSVSDDCEQVTGSYFVDCTEGRCMPLKERDESLARELWTISEELVKLDPDKAYELSDIIKSKLS